MKIDTLPQKIEVKGHPIFSGIKYCIANWNTLLYENGCDWENSTSVLWTEKELHSFRPNDTVHSFLLSQKESRQMEIDWLKTKIKAAKTSYKPDSKLYACNPKQLLKDRKEFLENHSLVFVEVNFIN